VRRVFLLAANDVRLTVRDRASFFWLLVMPLLFMWLFGQMGGGSSGPPRTSLTIDDRDRGWLALAFREELEDEGLVVRELSEERDPEAGAPARTLVIPEGFTEKVLAGEQQTLRIERGPQASDDFSLAAQVHTIRAITRILARLVELDLDEGEAALPAGSDEAPPSYRALAERPPLVRLEVSTAGEGRPVPSGYAQSVPGILTMTVLMMTLIYGGVFLTVEKQSGMLRRQASLPVSRRQIILGKLLGRLLVAALQLVLLVPAGRFLFGVSWGSSPAGLLLMLLAFCAAVAGLSTLLGAVLRTPEQASALGWLLAMGLSALGGCWWSSEFVPRPVWTASHVLPTPWAMDGFHALISFGRGVEAVLVPSGVLLGFAVIFSVIGARFLRFD
jgi:ABC-type multidrug transport system permease subunit